MRAASTTVVRWEFTRGDRRISCQVDQVAGAGPSAAFAVTLVPSWRGERPKREPFEALPAALCHHAALASTLRATGWTLVEYTA
jgi:hypothetical protein